MTAYVTGYFGRASENGHSALTTKVHLLKDGRCMCGYKPHKTMQFQFCANGITYGYIECSTCKQIASDLLSNYHNKKLLELKTK